MNLVSKSLNRLKNVKLSSILLLLLILWSLIVSSSFNSFLNIRNSPYHDSKDIVQTLKSSDTPSDSGYFKYYKIITIDHTKLVQPTYINFPFLISIYDAELHINVQENGNDIAFAIDTLWLDHEIEQFNKNYNTTHAKLIAWVRIPSLSGSVDTNITMYYGNSTMSSRQNPSGVWIANYKGVWHLSESTGNVLDSTLYGTSGTPTGTFSRQSTGVIDGAYDFGNNGQINFGDPSDGHLDMGTGSCSISFWVYINGPTGNYQLPLYKGATTNSDTGYDFETSFNSETLTFRICDGTDIAESPNMNVDFDNWMYIVGVVDRNSNYIRIFKNGMQQGSGSSTSSVGSISNNKALLAPTATYDLDGLLDEIRIVNVPRSAGWINTEYENQRNPYSFYTVGMQKIIPKELSNVNYFTFYKTITIDHTKITGTGSHVNFPLLISIFDSNLRYDVQPDGDDIAFAQDNEWLDHEIELFNQSYNATHSQLVAWVRVPFLFADVNTNITMYYSNSTMNSRQNPAGVWDAKYLAIHHMEEFPTGTIYDSTVNDEDLSTRGSMTSGDLVDAYIQKGIDFDNINDGAVSDNTITIYTFTFSAWIKSDTMQQWDCAINVGRFDSFFRWMGLNNGFFVVDDGTTYTFGSSLSTGTWNHILATFDGSTVRGYINGSYIDSYSVFWGSITDRFQIGAFAVDFSYNLNDFFDGIIDEVRILNTPLSADWIQTEFENQNDPDSFFNVGKENLVNNIPPNADNFNYYKVITIDHTKINGTGSHVNFPLLVSLLDEDLHFDVQNDGDDIAFSMDGKWLDYQIEQFNQSYSSTHAQLIAWVRIPFLSTAFDTNITMYYGNLTMSSRQNPTGVWYSDYSGVWHLNEDPSGVPLQIKDSTIYATDGATYGTMTSSDLVSGIIGGALDFDGINDYVNLGNPVDGHLDFGTGSFTISMWVNVDGSTGTWQIPLTKGHPSVLTSGYRFETNTNGQIIYFQISDGIVYETSYTQSVTFGTWMYLVGTVDRSSNELYLYKDGSASGYADISSIGSVDSTEGLTFSQNIKGTNGSLDEVRISNIARSNDWIATEYTNQFDPLSFYSVGSEQLAKEVLLADVQINAIDLYGNFITNLNISMYYYSQLVKTGVSNINGSAFFSGMPYGEYNFTVSMKSDIGNHLEIVNRTLEAVLIDKSFQTINLSCNVGTNFFEVEDIDGDPLDSGWIIVGNSSHNLRNCTIDNMGKAKFWWVNTTPYEYNYTIYYQDNQYNPKIIKLKSGNINNPNSTIPVQVELTTVDFFVLTFAGGEGVSGIKIKLRLNDTLGMHIVNLTTDQNGIATLRWLTSSGLNGNYSLQLEYYSENKLFNNTIGGPAIVDEIKFEVTSHLSREFRVSISLADFQTELVSLNPIDYIEVEWGEVLKLRILFNITKAGGLNHLLGPSYTDSMDFNVIRAGHIINSGSFFIEEDYLGKHYTYVDTSLLESKVAYLIIISAQKSGYALPSDLIFQLSVLENELILNQSENDDSARTVYWSESADMTVEPYGVASEDFVIRENIFQDGSHNFIFSLPGLENQWNLSQVIFNIYNISWTVGASDINITITDPYGRYYMFHASNHSGKDYALGKWTGIVINLNKNSPTANNNFEFVIGGSFSGTVDIVADAYFIRDKIEVKYVKFNITDTISIVSEAQGWAIKEIKFDLINCYETSTWNLINPLADAHLNITTNEGVKYSLDVGYGNGTGSLVMNSYLIYPLSGGFLFTIESSMDIIFDVIIYVDYVQEFYRNHYLEGINSSLTMNNINNGGVLQISVIDTSWIEQNGVLRVNGINNGITYFLPSELAMTITIGSQTFGITDFSRGYGTFSLTGYGMDTSYSAVITTNQQVNFTLDFILEYSRTVNYEVLGTVSYAIREAPSIYGDVLYDTNLAYYLQTIDTSLIDANDYTIRFTVVKEHYTSAIKDLDLIVLNRLTLINGSSEFFRSYQTIYVKDMLNLSFFYIDALTGTGLNNLDTFSYIWESYDNIGNIIDSGEGTLMFKSNGIYSLDFNTETRSVGEYLLIITFDKENYENKNGMVLLIIEKRIFNYTLGDNFREKQVNVVKGKKVPIEIRLSDSTKGNIPLENATILLIINGIEYKLEEFENGTYILEFSTEAVDAFFTSKILTGFINISKIDYISQEFQITIVVGMEEIFPGFPTFYFLLIVFGIISFAGSVAAYRVYKKAKIPRFVKRVRAIQKAIETEKEISEGLVYREKEVYIGEVMKEYWDALGLSLVETLGIEITKTKKSDRNQRREFTLKSEHEFRPIGLALMRWNERIGTEILARYPEDINLSDKSLMQIYSTHEYSADKGFVTLMTGSVNLLSYYTGPDKGYYLLLLLELDDDPDIYENVMVDILQILLLNLQDDSYLEILPSLFQRLSVYPSYNKEQMVYYTYQNDIKRIIIHYLQEDGLITKSELQIWLKDIYKEGFIDVEAALTELMKKGIIKQVSLKGLPSELIFLTKDIYMLRVPPTQLLKEPKRRGCPSIIVKEYQSEVKKFFQEYKPSREDNLKVIEILSLPQVYEVFKLLRTSIVTIQDLEKLRKKGIDDIYGVLKLLWDNNVIKVFHNDKNIEYYALISDFYVDYIFPKYITKIIKNAYEQKSKANKILIEYLKVLEQTYFEIRNNLKLN